MPTFKNPGILKFTAQIKGEGTEDSGGAFIEFPFDTKEKYGTSGRIPVKATFDGIPYKGTMVKYGTPKHILIIVKDIRKKIGKSIGDIIDVTLELDDGKREVVIPEDLKYELNKNLKLKEYFDNLAYSHRKEYVRWIEDAKRPETRVKRIEKTIHLLKIKKNN